METYYHRWGKMVQEKPSFLSEYHDVNGVIGRTRESLNVLEVKENVEKKIELVKIIERLESLYNELKWTSEAKLTWEEANKRRDDREIRDEIWSLEGKLPDYKWVFNASVVKQLYKIGSKGFVVNEVISNNESNGYIPYDGEEYVWYLDEDLAISLINDWYGGVVLEHMWLFEAWLGTVLEKLIEKKHFGTIMDHIKSIPDEHHQATICEIIKHWWSHLVGPKLSECRDLDIEKVIDLMMENGISSQDIERYVGNYFANIEQKINKKNSNVEKL